MLSVVVAAFLAVFVAELGDKSQVMAASLASRYSRRLLITAVILTATITVGAATLAGEVIGQVLPVRLTTLLAGLLFIGFAVQAWRTDDVDEVLDEEPTAGGLVRVVTTLTLAEIGDKTMLTTLGLASVSSSPLQVWLGGAAGMSLAGVLAVLVGGWLWTRLTPRAVRITSAAIFVIVGLTLVVVALM